MQRELWRQRFLGYIEVFGIIDKDSFVIKNGDEVSLENTERLIVANSKKLGLSFKFISMKEKLKIEEAELVKSQE